MPKDTNTAFSYFLSEKRRPHANMDEEVKRLHYQWKKLTEKDRKVYEDRAARGCGKKEKCDSTGRPLSELQNEVVLKRQKRQNMEELVQDMVKKSFKENELMKKSFFVICITHYVQDAEGYYHPAEVGVCRFSFEGGVCDTFSKIIPANIPAGDHLSANIHCQSTHKIPLKSTEDIIEEYEYFENYFDSFLHQKEGNASNSNMTFLFTEDEFMNRVEDMMEFFGLSFPIKICSLNFLLQEITSLLVTEEISRRITPILNVSQFEYNSNLSCKWHREEGSGAVAHCALNYAQRWIFNTFKEMNLRKNFGVILAEGRHFPKEMGVAFDFQEMSLDEKKKDSTWKVAGRSSSASQKAKKHSTSWGTRWSSSSEDSKHSPSQGVKCSTTKQSSFWGAKGSPSSQDSQHSPSQGVKHSSSWGAGRSNTSQNMRHSPPVFPDSPKTGHSASVRPTSQDAGHNSTRKNKEHSSSVPQSSHDKSYEGRSYRKATVSWDVNPFSSMDTNSTEEFPVLGAKPRKSNK